VRRWHLPTPGQPWPVEWTGHIRDLLTSAGVLRGVHFAIRLAEAWRRCIVRRRKKNRNASGRRIRRGMLRFVRTKLGTRQSWPGLVECLCQSDSESAASTRASSSLPSVHQLSLEHRTKIHRTGHIDTIFPTLLHVKQTLRGPATGHKLERKQLLERLQSQENSNDHPKQCSYAKRWHAERANTTYKRYAEPNRVVQTPE
jgi:hypothetical protein